MRERAMELEFPMRKKSDWVGVPREEKSDGVRVPP